MTEAERTQKLEDALYAFIELFDEVDGSMLMIGEEDDVVEVLTEAYDILNAETDDDEGF